MKPRNSSAAYAPVNSDESDEPIRNPRAPRPLEYVISRSTFLTYLAILGTALVCCFALVIALLRGPPSSSSSSPVSGGDCPCRPSDVPQYFQTSPERWAGPTATGKAPFLAATATFDPTATYVPNEPLRTSFPIEGREDGDENIFRMMGYLSPYAPSPGFGVNEYPLPEGAEIVQVHMLSRHGSRYPTRNNNVYDFGKRIAAAEGLEASGPLEFLNDYEYHLGQEMLVNRGRSELFESGILHSYMYAQLYDPDTKIIARTTTQNRMLKSAENFLTGFFGLEWRDNATIEVIIEQDKFNNSLAGWLNCPRGRRAPRRGSAHQKVWVETYLQNATERLSKHIEGYNWTVEDTYAAQNMCPYETVAYGFSRFCDLFTYQEWRDFSYSIDLAFYYNDGLGSPFGRAIGIGYQQEVLARLNNHTLGYSGSQINTTLDGSEVTFPLNQSLYFDFSHDTNIVSALAAFGLTQFEQPLPNSTYPGPHNFTVTHMTPFGGRLDIEIIKTPRPLAADRSGYLPDGGETRYVHFVLNQRTVPLGWSFPECDVRRADGWCEFDAFLEAQARMPGLAQYEKMCQGEASDAVEDVEESAWREKEWR